MVLPIEDTCIGRQRRGRPHDIPMFPIDIWGVYDRTVNRLPRTNNHIETWHKRFNLTCRMAHPNIWKFVNVLKNEESLIRAEYQQLLGGHPPPPPKKTYADSAARGHNIASTMHTCIRVPNNFLKTIREKELGTSSPLSIIIVHSVVMGLELQSTPFNSNVQGNT